MNKPDHSNQVVQKDKTRNGEKNNSVKDKLKKDKQKKKLDCNNLTPAPHQPSMSTKSELTEDKSQKKLTCNGLTASDSPPLTQPRQSSQPTQPDRERGREHDRRIASRLHHRERKERKRAERQEARAEEKRREEERKERVRVRRGEKIEKERRREREKGRCGKEECVRLAIRIDPQALQPAPQRPPSPPLSPIVVFLPDASNSEDTCTSHSATATTTLSSTSTSSTPSSASTPPSPSPPSPPPPSPSPSTSPLLSSLPNVILHPTRTPPFAWLAKANSYFLVADEYRLEV